jgi:hypothetical protein
MIIQKKSGLNSFKTLLAAWLAVLVLTGAAFAAESGPAETCERMDDIKVDCIVCETGEVVGQVSVRAEYDPAEGGCMKRYKEARKKCINKYGMPRINAGCKWSYSMANTRFVGLLGGDKYKGIYPGRCQK